MEKKTLDSRNPQDEKKNESLSVASVSNRKRLVGGWGGGVRKDEIFVLNLFPTFRNIINFLVRSDGRLCCRSTV